ncbi:cupin domain-containing protein [Aureimonas populi]|uniref:Cupin domain-containing protein n=1 Tax=Aureimonas populi TaxID=1701758 RepID=A0ABW5CKI3_9HYPH|nr:cupin domain-containing protein [Aureimonas populi]
MPLNDLMADAIIKQLSMTRHPEGGWYVETFRDEGGGARGHSTAIYFLLKRGERSHWHRVGDASEIWLYHAGAPLSLSLWDEGETFRIIRLGPDLVLGEQPQAVVPANVWQAAESEGDFTLVSCVVAPGFLFSSFELAPPGWEPPFESR